MNSGYGYGYDRQRPDLFSPDIDSCTRIELENHEAALNEYYACQARGEQFICTTGSWGIGLYQYEDNEL